MQECLSYFGELTESQQLQAAGMFKHRVNKDVKNPSALLTRLAANVQNASKISGLKHPTPSANYIPAKPGSYLNAQRFSDTLFLYNLSAVGTSTLYVHQTVTLSCLHLTTICF